MDTVLYTKGIIKHNKNGRVQKTNMPKIGQISGLKISYSFLIVNKNILDFTAYMSVISKNDISHNSDYRSNISYAPVKKRIHTDTTTVIVGDARKALFTYSQKKSRNSSISEDKIETQEEALPVSEEVHEKRSKQTNSCETRLTRLQIASLLYDNIPLFSPSKLASQVHCRQRVSVNMKIKKDHYIKIFGGLGKRKDLSHLAIPVDDPFELYYQHMKELNIKGIPLSRDALLTRWLALPSETKKDYETKLTEVKRKYNEQFNEMYEMKQSGTLPIYEKRTISNLQELEDVLGPASLRKTVTGYRTTAGQVSVVIAVNSPIQVIYDEIDQSIEIQFSASPVIDLYVF